MDRVRSGSRGVPPDPSVARTATGADEGSEGSASGLPCAPTVITGVVGGPNRSGFGGAGAGLSESSAAASLERYVVVPQRLHLEK